MRAGSIFFILFFRVAACCFAQSYSNLPKQDSVFHAGVNMILAELPNDFKKLRGKEFYENNGGFNQRFASNFSLPSAALSYITSKYEMAAGLHFSFHSCWNFPLRDSAAMYHKADSIALLLTGGTYDCCQTLHSKDYSNKKNYFRFFFTDGIKADMSTVFENLYMELTIEKDYIKKGVKGFVVHLEILTRALPNGSE